MSDKPTATWGVCLWVKCPHCKEGVDLLDAPDFWDGRNSDTFDADELTECCPKCGEEITCTVVY
jgi:hypothetical protein